MKDKILILLTIISTLAVISYLALELHTDPFILILIFWWLAIPLILIYIITLAITIIKIFRKGIRRNIILFTIHSITILALISSSLYHSEIFKSKIVLEANLHDDLSGISLILRENQKFECTSYGLFGMIEKKTGRYVQQKDTIIFLNKPYTNNFIPNKIIIDNTQNAIFFLKDNKGNYVKEKEFASYFEIHKNNLKF